MPEASAPVARPRRPREPQGAAWGRDFVLADAMRGPSLIAVSATCLLHQAEGLRCNKWCQLSGTIDRDEAERRIKEWCVRGYAVPDGVGARNEHMKPRQQISKWPMTEVRPNDVLERLIRR